jgi:hypothetical protein
MSSISASTREARSVSDSYDAGRCKAAATISLLARWRSKAMAIVSHVVSDG